MLPSGPDAPAQSGPGTSTATTPPPLSQRPQDRQCLADLGKAGVRFDTLPDRYIGEGCSNLNTVQMHALAGDRGALEVRNVGPVTCAVSAAFAAWARYGVDRAAQQVFGSPLATIQTMGSFNCRNVAGTARRSAHASADAIDIGGFVLADGRRISVADGWSGSTQEREFLRLIQRSACRRFDTVLSPDYNSAHRDHLHLEGVIDGNSFCR
ncbi:extensin [Erythrobacter sp. GH3-10]|uniref:Extensin n=2 Tax=Aurantiacibacter rhizosphaerae TaxID=2691582 RepID=A0A844XFY0_9SPHN|nr:extensin [Aurantiacibacter rhizosphaerae]